MSSVSASEFERRRRAYEATVLSYVWERKDSMNVEPSPTGREIIRVSLSGEPPETQLNVEWTVYGAPTDTVLGAICTSRAQTGPDRPSGRV
jgi:hypothetical protein